MYLIPILIELSIAIFGCEVNESIRIQRMSLSHYTIIQKNMNLDIDLVFVAVCDGLGLGDEGLLLLRVLVRQDRLLRKFTASDLKRIKIPPTPLYHLIMISTLIDPVFRDKQNIKAVLLKVHISSLVFAFLFILKIMGFLALALLA